MGRLEVIVRFLAMALNYAVDEMTRDAKLGPWTKEKLIDMLSKVEWEGGIFEAFNGYGVRPRDYDVKDEKLDRLIDELDAAYDRLESHIEDLKDEHDISDDDVLE